jgi:BASS family bile acid:Na+ symporter
MAGLAVLTDIKLWVVLGIILGLAVGFDHPDSGTILMAALMFQMILALDGLDFHRDDFSRYKRSIAISIGCCFILNTSITLLTGLFFIDDTALWYGWVMLAAVPCAVSLISASLFMHGDTKMAVLSLISIYLVAMAASPIITKLLIGDAINPLDILKYIILFVVIPFAITIPLKRLHLPRVPKLIGINAMMLILVMIGLGSRRDYIFSEPEVIFWLVLACVLRVFVFSVIMVPLIRRTGCRREDGVIYMVLSIWRNSSMAVSMCMVLLSEQYPEAVLPAIISLVVESTWFAFINGTIDRMWPREESAPAQ